MKKENETVKDENLTLKKINTNLESSLTKYALLLTEEKSEKKEILGKYDDVQKELRETERNYNLRIQKMVQQYYLLIGFSVMLVIFILAMNVKNIISFFGQ